ncbi:hypothetical protein NDU88_004128 [Pleurodeles waltl]|uniref:Gypsy retrotransposon integrase-like protein 1 n=1 Tax=Pleurodeles waltl TaxID=8319 RepID=A0AAV7LKE2_PLEWA|nr:hypothetical protein NDU88_004128 [Pleurodeles waltl]
MDKYKQLPLINGVEVQAYRDTGASVTMVIEKLVHREQHLLGHQYQVTDAHNNTLSHPMAVVNLNWGGVTGPKKVVVATDLPVDCLLENDLETSAWSDVELDAHAAMLGIPGHIFALTRAQAKKQKGQGSLDPGTMDQVLPKARARRSKPLPTIPPSTVDSTSEEEEFPPCAEPTPEELEADTAELLGEGGPAREELSVAQQTCPTLEGLRQQAVKQANGDVSDSHRVYWEDNLLYTKARDPKPGAARRLVIPQEYRKFLLTLAHDIPLAGHLGQMKTWDRLVPLFHWPRMSEDTKEFWYLWNKGTKSKSHKQVGDGQMPMKCQLRVQRSFYWTEEAEVSAGTKRARDFPFGGRIPLAVESRAEVFSRRKNANKPC